MPPPRAGRQETDRRLEPDPRLQPALPPLLHELRAEPDPDELSTREALSVVDDLAAFGIPVIIFSGGDPLLHPGLFEIAGRAADRGISISLSTNGTLIDETTVTAVKSAGFRYVGVSVDGAGPAVNDRLRGHPGAFAEAIRGIRLCRDAGLTVGLRFTLSKNNVHDLPGLFDLADRERIDRVSHRSSRLRRARREDRSPRPVGRGNAEGHGFDPRPGGKAPPPRGGRLRS